MELWRPFSSGALAILPSAHSHTHHPHTHTQFGGFVRIRDRLGQCEDDDLAKVHTMHTMHARAMLATGNILAAEVQRVHVRLHRCCCPVGLSHRPCAANTTLTCRSRRRSRRSAALASTETPRAAATGGRLPVSARPRESSACGCWEGPGAPCCSKGPQAGLPRTGRQTAAAKILCAPLRRLGLLARGWPRLPTGVTTLRASPCHPQHRRLGDSL